MEWQPTETTWLEVGRVNIRDGVALGFNPTDFFRPRTVVEPLTADPSVLREDRLGTLMLTGQALWRYGFRHGGLRPESDRCRRRSTTSATSKISIPASTGPMPRTGSWSKTSLNLAERFNPELLWYHAGNRTQFGANLTTPVSRGIVAYAEWAGGVRRI